MKKSLMFLSMLLCMICMTAQTQTKKVITKKPNLSGPSRDVAKADGSVEYVKYDKSNTKNAEFAYDGGPISYVTPKKDTLYLRNNDLGNTIMRVWKDHNYPDKPVILMVDVLPNAIKVIKMPKIKKV